MNKLIFLTKEKNTQKNTLEYFKGLVLLSDFYIILGIEFPPEFF